MSNSHAGERQLTFDPRHHDLDNNLDFSRDGKWLVYDTRNPGLDTSKTIEKVNVDTGEQVVLYAADKGAEGPVNGAGAASFSPKDDRIVCIHGPWAKTGLAYDFTVRRGGLIGTDGSFAFADARDITPPYTPGALRGGTHRHDWDHTGQWLGYTYNDDIMKKKNGVDLRFIGVTKLGLPVKVSNAREDLFEGDGEGFSVLVTRVVPNPKPGSDEINRSAQDMWVGTHGYKRADGKLQLARAFVGTTIAASGEPVDEVYVVDVPDDITQPGPDGPLEGTDTTFPAPPVGASQRRLTWTANSPHPGVVGNCWSSPDGNWITFIAKDATGVDQIFAVHPTGGDSVQVTAMKAGVACSPRWFPDGKRLLAVSLEGRLFMVGAPGSATNDPVYLTEPSESHPVKPALSPDGNLVAFNRLLPDEKGEHLQVFVVPVPD